jgi:hypothetical protein
MSDPRRPVDDARDPALDAAWRAHSTELPPPTIDAALRAAAHREVGARPRPLGDEDDALAEARTPARWWWGLAAAATIGAIAFGIVQLAPPPADPMVASDMTRADAKPQDSAPPQASQAVPRADPTQQRDATRPAPPASPPREPVASPPFPPAQPGIAQQDAGSREKLAAQAPAERKRAAAPAPQPFPATPSEPSREQLARQQPSARDRGDEARADDYKSPAQAPSATAKRREEAPVIASAAAPSEPAPSTFAAPAPAQAPAAMRAVQDWIERIRDLYDARRFDEAARELNAFRDAHADADARLPERLRGWAATVPKTR